MEGRVFMSERKKHTNRLLVFMGLPWLLLLVSLVKHRSILRELLFWLTEREACSWPISWFFRRRGRDGRPFIFWMKTRSAAVEEIRFPGWKERPFPHIITMTGILKLLILQGKTSGRSELHPLPVRYFIFTMTESSTRLQRGILAVHWILSPAAWFAWLR